MRTTFAALCDNCHNWASDCGWVSVDGGKGFNSGAKLMCSGCQIAVADRKRKR